ncbi:alpha/beta hydrolase [Modestobacter sp. VKM Ac-2979]|uniref:alpha/beta hydrolase n=1 Tax=unclassified Modestobacter TaxID=2643866 RepID=UPI0022AB5A85|nr:MULTISPECIES: alpha/beta hydrolase [unclassified Modestobacter]MCZ2813412.1 alpha/beta hydrolase [Modestobacter sp. VKM Ac-2979]MCZ2842396.1 alpha/beta hydrolase [Modestobacter sp. VKM Ac-2980]
MKSPATSRPGLPAAALGVTALVLTLSACSSSSEPTARLDPGPDNVRVEEGLTYWSDDQSELKLDACLPTDAEEPVAAVLLVHGGGFTEGTRDSSGLRTLCELTAEQGAAAFSVDYRLAPEFTYPAQVDDLANAVQWLREPAQVEAFGIDPARIGAIGSSAGAIIAQSLATRGEGPLDTGARLGAVASLSGVSVLSPEGLELGRPSEQAADLVLNYLGCTSVTDCPQSVPASPITGVDPSDPPMLLVNGTDELVPEEQPEALATALEDAGVPAELLIVDAPSHGITLLDSDVRRAVLGFLEEQL